MRRLRFDGPIMKGVPDAPLMWTVIDPYSYYFKYTNSKATLLEMGFTELEMQEAIEWGTLS